MFSFVTLTIHWQIYYHKTKMEQNFFLISLILNCTDCYAVE